MRPVRDAEDFAVRFGVSRETIAALKEYERQLRRWNPRINLVSDASLPDIWNRHFADSAQLLAKSTQQSGLWADLGSGAGFPGLVVAILLHDSPERRPVALVESDTRKAAFLASVARELAPDTQTYTDRAETLDPLGANTVSARALATLPQLLDLASRHLKPGGECLFLKGARAESELTMARQNWMIREEKFPSMTDPGGVILRIGDLRRV